MKQQDKEIYSLNQIIEDQTRKIDLLEGDINQLNTTIAQMRDDQTNSAEASQLKKAKKQMKQLLARHKEQSEAYEQQLQYKEKEIEALKFEIDQLRRDLQTSFRSIGERVVKQSFHFNSSNNNIQPA